MAGQILLLDVGNSRLKWAWLAGEDFEAGGELSHTGRIDPETQLRAEGMSHPEQIIAACVAGAAMETSVQAWMTRQYHQSVTFLSSPAQGCGVINRYSNPASLGIDRWAAMVAARHSYSGDLLVVDAGSAITLDIIRGDGQHLGGYILPGLGLMRAALQGSTDLKIDMDIESVKPDTSPGNSTVSCIQHGILMAVCSLIEASLSQLEKRRGETVQCIMTGGDHQLIAAGLNIPSYAEPLLVLQGLARIARSTESMQ
ncbi:MAG: type III pantothenate kinase [Proteobacteria bacterium]|jgi:type III pantothenate kinase|nr:type III pantothenate kinase [Pseudomonadota bacterium]